MNETPPLKLLIVDANGELVPDDVELQPALYTAGYIAHRNGLRPPAAPGDAQGYLEALLSTPQVAELVGDALVRLLRKGEPRTVAAMLERIITPQAGSESPSGLKKLDNAALLQLVRTAKKG